MASLAEDERARISILIDHESEKDSHFKQLLSHLLELIGQRELWDALGKNNLLQNIGKLNTIRQAISKGMLLIQSDDAELARNLRRNFDAAMKDIKIDVNWKVNVTTEEWLEEPVIKQRIAKESRQAALNNLEEIKLDKFVGEDLIRAKEEIQRMKNKLGNETMEYQEILSRNEKIKRMQDAFNKGKFIEWGDEIPDDAYFSTSQTPQLIDEYNSTTFSIPRAEALSEDKFPNLSTAQREE